MTVARAVPRRRSVLGVLRRVSWPRRVDHTVERRGRPPVLIRRGSPGQLTAEDLGRKVTARVPPRKPFAARWRA